MQPSKPKSPAFAYLQPLKAMKKLKHIHTHIPKAINTPETYQWGGT